MPKKIIKKLKKIWEKFEDSSPPSQTGQAGQVAFPSTGAIESKQPRPRSKIAKELKFIKDLIRIPFAKSFTFPSYFVQRCLAEEDRYVIVGKSL